ncbi:hypothetical protein DERP_015266 [Dermatophagoides pteronyssinus]|uniref:Uncharacterized protein n=1 Tax=Dermatophagoides pteronyssinus TaxID=6956 RepID=A0ABQ8JKP5_DERPT|nr:hypothetical protein DERP_015266 [Dermatophagoides pteronyssinus]
MRKNSKFFFKIHTGIIIGRPFSPKPLELLLKGSGITASNIPSQLIVNDDNDKKKKVYHRSTTTMIFSEKSNQLQKSIEEGFKFAK